MKRRDADPEIMLPDKPGEIHPINSHSIDAENVEKQLSKRGVEQDYLDLMLAARK